MTARGPFVSVALTNPADLIYAQHAFMPQKMPGGDQMPDGCQMPDGDQMTGGDQMPDGGQMPDGDQMTHPHLLFSSCLEFTSTSMYSLAHEADAHAYMYSLAQHLPRRSHAQFVHATLCVRRRTKALRPRTSFTSATLSGRHRSASNRG